MDIQRIITCCIVVMTLNTRATDGNYLVSLHNNGTSTLYVTNNQDIGNETDVQELEKSDSIALAPRESDVIDAGRYFSVYSRQPKSNYKYQRHFTIVFKQESESDEEILLNLPDNNSPEETSIIVVNHLSKEKTPEAIHNLCPDGSKAQKINATDMYFCAVPSYDKKLKEYTTTYVPVIHYAYTYLPSWVTNTWYTQNPILYHLYDQDTSYHGKLTNYQPPWKTSWYAQWYKKQPEKTVEHLKRPT